MIKDLVAVRMVKHPQKGQKKRDAKKNKIAIISEMIKLILDLDVVQMERHLPKVQKIKDALNALKR